MTYRGIIQAHNFKFFEWWYMALYGTLFPEAVYVTLDIIYIQLL